MHKSMANFSPSRTIIGSILLAIGVSTFLLSLPIAQNKPISLLDSFFMATSSICVCGLSTVSLFDFSFVGHCIILALMQIGGLSLVTLTLFLLAIFIRKFGLRTQLIASQLMELDSWKDFKRILFFTIIVTAFCEFFGAIAIYFSIAPYFSMSEAIFLSIFHSVSSFCHVGFTLFPEEMLAFTGNYTFLITTILLMFTGGFGFLALHDLFEYLQNLHTKKRNHLALHTQIALIMAGAIVLSSIILYWIVEHQNTLSYLNPTTGFINALFNCVAARGAGFSTIYIHELQFSTLLLFMAVAFIGASPNSTGSGIKTTTMALIIAGVKAAITGKATSTLRGRSIAHDQLLRALAIFILSITFIFFVTFCLLITEKGHSFLNVAFESLSAFATLGMSLGLTPYLTVSGKLIVIMTMLMGRIGPLGFILAVQPQVEAQEFSYPEERVILS
jgi:trk system potassium uptake protein TrkH